ncbi:unnamed protein product [Larinioides sclopetarius]|uniref:Uncharacterized protein n=1 Tax=Larinioides sclopetarius TaxID=280406 RepID=A0AAV1Z4Z0_9ARAC
MKKLKPPSYEETIAAGPPQHSSKKNISYRPDEELAFSAIDIRNDQLIKVSVFQHAPTAPTIGVIKSPLAPHAPTAPTIGTIESIEAPLLSLDPLTDPELRAVLFKHKKNFACGASKFISEMTLSDIQNDCALHYKLESFGEKRECTPRFTGYYGQNIDGPENGVAPDKWNVPIGMPIKFVDHQITTEIPHTAYVKECSTCEGEKKIDCTPCWARGKCTGRGTIDCSFCDGYGKVKYYMLLVVTWKNHVDDIVSNRYNLPEELILEASGQEIFTKQADQVEPLNTAHVTLNEASAVLIEKHHLSIRNEAIRDQRHSLRAVPVTRATYVWRNKKGEFYVYGFERNVYFEDYPQQCCWCACC